MNKLDLNEDTEIVKDPVKEESQASGNSEVLLNGLLVRDESLLDSEVLIKELSKSK